MNLRRYAPDSLFVRLFIAILAALAGALIVIVVLILNERRQMRVIWNNAGSSAATIVGTTQFLTSLPPQRRRETLEEIKDAPLFGVTEPPGTATVLRGEVGSFEKAFSTRVQQGLGAGYRVQTERSDGPPALAIALDAPFFAPIPGSRAAPLGPGAPMMDVRVALPEGERVLFRTPAPPPPPNLGLQIFVRLGVLTLTLGLVLFAMTRTITRPLAELAQAADAAGRGHPSRRLREKGPPEIRAAVRAYNAMQERLHRYLDSRTRVLAAMSHDLRTPLARLQLRVDSISEDTLRNSLSRDVEEMTHMVRGALSAFRGLNDEESAKWTDINALVATIATHVSDAGREIAVAGGASALYHCRPLALKRCLVNLVDNALRHGDRIDIRIGDGDALTVSIEDDGPGIPAPLLEQVFEPFFRLESSRNRDSGGTGLGLCIARDIAQAHNGTLTLRNLASGGLAATLTLPREPRTEI